jgi:tripartite-type tricarboxylate transporter receptor subunit TctC
MKKVMFAAAFAALVSAGQAGAQQFPARPVTMVIPFAAGGPQDNCSVSKSSLKTSAAQVA